MKKVFSIIFSVIICLLVGWFSRIIHADSMETWYPMLNKSSLTPPNTVFFIVWCLLYVLIGISAGLLYNVHNISKRPLLWLFVIQLLFNITWNFFFFYMRSPILGFVNLLILDVLAVAFFIGSLWVKRLSAFYFLPYLLWLLFASYLNMYMVIYN